MSGVGSHTHVSLSVGLLTSRVVGSLPLLESLEAESRVVLFCAAEKHVSVFVCSNATNS